MAYFSNICWQAMCCYPCQSVGGALSFHAYIRAGWSDTTAKLTIDTKTCKWVAYFCTNTVELSFVTLLLLSKKIMKHQRVVSLHYCAKWKLGSFQGTVTPCCPIELHQAEVTSGVIWLWIRVSTYHLSYWSLRDRSDKLITLGSNTIASCNLAESVFLYKHPRQQNFGVHARQKVDCKGENTVQQLQSEYITDILMAGLQTCEQAPWPQIRQTFHLAEEVRRNLSKKIALARTPQLMLFRE